LPRGITTISYGMFEGCVALSDITIPNSVTMIDNWAFAKCRSLTDITIPDSVISIGYGAFQDCSSLNSITLGKGVVSIDNSAFYGCDNLRAVHYTGTRAISNKLIIGSFNTCLTNATWYYRLYPDVATNDWYSDAVKYVSENGIMSGYQNGLFGTSNSIQRQDFLVMLARLEGVDLATYSAKMSVFPDVPEGSYFEAAVNWGSENGIVTGYQNGKFGVGDKVTREQLVTFLCRYANYKGIDTTCTASQKNAVIYKYYDFKNVSSFAQDAIFWAVNNGVINGKTSTTIVPQGNAQRCEVAKIMYNIYLNDIF
ncbi:MAG: leucine-rich repeat protein, partial [Clostridia bacterium]|nr:leucine-rich repeat protein [Clostridia bacterium]